MGYDRLIFSFTPIFIGAVIQNIPLCLLGMSVLMYNMFDTYMEKMKDK